MDEAARGARRRARGGDPQAVARDLLARMRAGELDERRVAAAVALGHEAARLTGVAPADLPLNVPVTDAEFEALGAVNTDDDAAFKVVAEPLRRYLRRVEAVLTYLEAGERVAVAADCVAHAFWSTAGEGRLHVEGALGLSARWPRVSEEECHALQRTLFDASEQGDHRSRSVLLAATFLVSGLDRVDVEVDRLASAIDNAVRGAADEAAEVAWQTERLCAALLGLD